MVVGPLVMSRVPRKNARQTRVRVPARETSTPTVPRSLGGQDSRFSLSQTHAMHTLIFFRKEASTPGFTLDWVRLPACDAGKFHALLLTKWWQGRGTGLRDVSYQAAMLMSRPSEFRSRGFGALVEMRASTSVTRPVPLQAGNGTKKRVPLWKVGGLRD